MKEVFKNERVTKTKLLFTEKKILHFKVSILKDVLNTKFCLRESTCNIRQKVLIFEIKY